MAKLGWVQGGGGILMGSLAVKVRISDKNILIASRTDTRQCTKALGIEKNGYVENSKT